MMGYVFAAVATLALVVLLAVQAYRVVKGYALSTGTPWQKFLATFSHSETILLSRIVSFGAATLAFLQSWLPTLDPSSQMGDAIKAVLQPQYTPWYILCFSLLVEWLRRRPGSISPALPPPQAVVVPPAPLQVVSSLAMTASAADPGAI